MKKKISKSQFMSLLASNKDISNIDYSHITDFSYLFEGCRYLKNIPELDVSHVTNMEGMFDGCEKFNHDISKWDVSNVTNMEGMFYQCYNFNQDLSNWNTSNVTNMSHMFHLCSSFNHPVENWDVGNVETMRAMFLYCSNFNQPLNNWDVGNVENMAHMFGLALTFNQPLDKWDVSNVKNTIVMFYIPEDTEERLSHILKKAQNKRNITDEEELFLKKHGFKYPYPINYSSFNQSLHSWKFLGNIRVSNMFNEGEKFVKHFGIDKTIQILCSYDILDDFTKKTLLNMNKKETSLVSNIVNSHLVKK